MLVDAHVLRTANDRAAIEQMLNERGVRPLVHYIARGDSVALHALRRSYGDRFTVSTRVDDATDTLIINAIEKKDPRKRHTLTCRLLERNFYLTRHWLEAFGPLQAVECGGGGHCQFGTIAQVVYGDKTKYQQVRNEIVEHIRGNKEFETVYEDSYTPNFMTLEDYLVALQFTREWGTTKTLIVAADLYRVCFYVFRNGDRGWHDAILEVVGDPNNPHVHIMHHGAHYQSVSLVDPLVTPRRPQMQSALAGKPSFADVVNSNSKANKLARDGQLVKPRASAQPVVQQQSIAAKRVDVSKAPQKQQPSSNVQSTKVVSSASIVERYV